MGCFVFLRLGLVVCGLLLRGGRRRLGGLCFCFWLLVLFVRILRFVWKEVLGNRE